MVRNGRVVLNVPSVVFDKSGITVVLGANGAGKTLLLRTVTGLVEPDAGDVTWAGYSPARRRYHKLGLILQKPVLLRRPALANIVFALIAAGHSPGVARKKAARALDQAGLAHLARTSARNLSGGEQQRLALARALCLDPEILLLDEPTASLDPAATLAIETVIVNTARRARPVVLVTHDIAQARRMADHVVFMHGGKILEQTSAEQFFNSPRCAEAAAYLDGKIVL